MNIRSLTRGDGVVIGAAVLLFIASFLDFYSVDCSGQFCDKSELPNLWDSKLFPVLPTVVLAGIVGAVLIIAGRFQPQGRNLLGLTLDQWGTALTVFAAWSSLWTMFGGALEDNDKVGAGVGRILALIALLVMAAGALLTQRIPALKAPLMGAPAPQAPSPYGAGPGYGYPGPGGMQQGQAPYGAQQQPYGAQTGQTGQPQHQQQDQSAPAQAQPAGPVGPSPPRRPPVTSPRSGSRCRWPAPCTGRTARRRRSPSWRPARGTSRWTSAVRRSSRRRRTADAACCRTRRASSAAEARAGGSSAIEGPPGCPAGLRRSRHRVPLAGAGRSPVQSPDLA